MKKRLVSLLFFAVFILLISNISAGFSIGNASNDIAKVYGLGENIKGWINLSLSAVPLTTQITDTRNNSINIIDLLKSDSRLIKDKDYSCTPSDCGISYVASNGQKTKSFTLNSGDTKLLGFKFSGDLKEIENVTFDIESNAGSSCMNQMEITFMTEDEIILGNNKTDSSICDVLRDDGCFNESKTTYTNPYIAEGPGKKHCQRISLKESPGFRLAAWMNLVSSGDITLAIYDLRLDEELASCEIPGTTGNGEFYCDVNYPITQEDYYYVCIYSDKASETSRIRGYAAIDGCGFYDNTGMPGDELYAYDISATGKRFDSVGKLNIGDELQGDISLAERFDDTITQMGDCSSGCVIPIKIKSNVNQNINISNINIRYIGGTGPDSLDEVYDVSTTSAAVSTNGSKLIYMDYANFTLPRAAGGFPYTLKINETKIVNFSLTIQPSPQITALSPLTTASKFPTTFYVFVTKVGNDTIKSYSWDFNGSILTTTTPSISYPFDEIGVYPVKVSVEDTAGRISSRTFNVNVGSYASVLNSRINKSKLDLQRIETQLLNFSQFEQNEIKKIINPTSLKSNLTQVESLYGQGNLEGAVTLLLTLDIPESIIAGIKTTSVPFYPSMENINLDSVGTNYEASKEGEYISAIMRWHTTNLDTSVKYSKIIAQYEGGREELILNVMEFTAKKKSAMNYSSAIYLQELDDLAFASAYGQNSSSGYVKIPLDSQEKTITFSTTEDVSFYDIPIFISPAISNLVLIGDIEEEQAAMRWALFILLIFFLLIAGFIVYIVLQQWYKTKYENYLFKDRNHLFNLITYIQNSKKKGMAESEMIKKLKKAGWNSEQITYVMNKYIGKRTGMLEIPIDKFLSWFRKKENAGNIAQASTVPLPMMAPRVAKPIIPVQRNFPAQRFPGTSPAGKPFQPDKKEFFQK